MQVMDKNSFNISDVTNTAFNTIFVMNSDTTTLNSPFEISSFNKLEIIWGHDGVILNEWSAPGALNLLSSFLRGGDKGNVKGATVKAAGEKPVLDLPDAFHRILFVLWCC